MLVPSPRASGEKVVRQHRMRGCGRWGAIDVAAVRKRRFIGPTGEAKKRPSSAAAAAPSPRRHGEKGPACAFTSVQPCILATTPAVPSPRASGEKVVRQHRMRGRGRWGAIDVAAARTRYFIGGCRRSPKAPLIRPAGHLLPVATGRRDSKRFLQNAASRSCNDPVAGEARKRPSSAAAAAPSPRRHGEKGLHALPPECICAFLRRHQPPFTPRQRGEEPAPDSIRGGAAAPDEGPWEVGRNRRCTRAQAPLHPLCR